DRNTMLPAKLGKSLVVDRNHALKCLRARPFVNGGYTDSPSNYFFTCEPSQTALQRSQPKTWHCSWIEQAINKQDTSLTPLLSRASSRGKGCELRSLIRIAGSTGWLQ
ncbi:MAG: hypothetical protein PVG79_01980, partial [Gemmatimonadales bacterium]